MSTATDELDRLIDEFLAGHQPFMVFWRAFMDRYVEELTDAEAAEYEAAYDTVYMGADGEVAAEDDVVGVLSDAEIRRQLAAFRAQRSGGPAA